MAVILTETWTGTDGDPWDATRWVTGSFSGTIDIHHNQGRLAFPSTANARAYGYSLVSATDAEVVLEFSYPAAGGTPDGRLMVCLRSTTTDDDVDSSANGYELRFSSRDGQPAELNVISSGSRSTLDSTSFDPTSGVTYRLRFRVEGSTIQAKWWDTSGSEPGSWIFSETDTTHTGAGHLWIGFRRIGSSREVRVDNLTLDDLAAAPAFEAEGDWASGSDFWTAAATSDVPAFEGVGSWSSAADTWAGAAEFTAPVVPDPTPEGHLLHADGFTGVDDDPPDPAYWDVDAVAGASATIQGNRLRVTVDDQADSEVDVVQTGLPAVVDAEVLVLVEAGGDADLGVLARWTQATITGYSLWVYPDGEVTLFSAVADVWSELAAEATSVDPSEPFWVRFQVVGSTLQGRVWAYGTAEPGSWTITTTDTAVAGAGRAGLSWVRFDGGPWPAFVDEWDWSTFDDVEVEAVGSWSSDGDGWSATATSSVPAFEAEGDWASGSDFWTAAGTTTAPGFEAEGSWASGADSWAATATSDVPAFEGVGSWSSAGDGWVAAATSTVPEFGAAGAWVGDDDAWAGAAATTAPGFVAAGTWTSADDTWAGSAEVEVPAYVAEGAWSSAGDVWVGVGEVERPEGVVTGLWTSADDTWVGAASSTVPGFEGVGSWSSSSDVWAGTAEATAPAFTAAGSWQDGDDVWSATVSTTRPEGTAAASWVSGPDVWTGTAGSAGPAGTVGLWSSGDDVWAAVGLVVAPEGGPGRVVLPGAVGTGVLPGQVDAGALPGTVQVGAGLPGRL